MIELGEDDQIRLLMRVAFDDAFKAQIMALYRTYLTNTAGGGIDEQRVRTRTGIENAIAGYRLALEVYRTMGEMNGLQYYRSWQ